MAVRRDHRALYPGPWLQRLGASEETQIHTKGGALCLICDPLRVADLIRWRGEDSCHAISGAIANGFSASELRQLAKRSKDNNQSRRLLSLAAVADGMRPAKRGKNASRHQTQSLQSECVTAHMSVNLNDRWYDAPFIDRINTYNTWHNRASTWFQRRLLLQRQKS